VEVLVLHRLIPPKSARGSRRLDPLRQPRHADLDGLAVTYVPFVAPPRPRSYASWGRWAAPTLRLALRRRRRFDLVHAHYATPAGDAVRRAGVPYVVSVHGGDVLAYPEASRAGLEGARLALANSEGIAERARALGGRDVRVVHLGTDVPPSPPERRHDVVSVGNLVARKRHADLIRALPPGRRLTIVGDGPERAALEALGGDVEFTGSIPHREAVAIAQSARVFALPSVDEAFGVAYIEAMAGGVPAIGCAGEPGPEEIARCGTGMTLVPAGDVDALRRAIEAPEPGDPRATVEAHFTWDRCGRATVAAYEAALK
jgi:glycosyltransferase involved in cell wall biosynthesis